MSNRAKRKAWEAEQAKALARRHFSAGVVAVRAGRRGSARDVLAYLKIAERIELF